LADTLPDRPSSPSVSGGAAPALADGGIDTQEDAIASLLSVEAEGIETDNLTPRQVAIRRFRRHKLAMASLIILSLMSLATILAPILAKHGYAQIPVPSVLFRLKHPQTAHPFGTDAIGRDMFSRVLYGGRVSLAVGVGVAFLSTVIGTTVGAISGYYGGKLDNFLMRFTDLLLSIPLLVILIVMAKILGGSIADITIILSLFFWMPLARIVRGLFLSMKNKEFVEAARSVGASDRRIMFRHILPNCIGPIIVNATLAVAAAILTESVLSFLGFGIQPPVPTWGNLLDDGRNYTTTAPWLVWFPGLAILITVLCVNFLGDGLRDALDPTQRRVRQ
jgi:peptide/nickel transport system permease protein